ncbi:NB-ARC domain-containing protein [Micromonospora violae]|uniref:NB-ARC domain-containing protein n=1 Tax=Micromonospora violae TaxID=1278207 RepID=UPI003408327A
MLGALAVFIGVVVGLAANAATSDDYWPGPLDWVRRMAWWWVGACAIALAILGLVNHWLANRLTPQAHDVAPPPQNLPPWVIPPGQVDELVDSVCARPGRTVGITTALEGAGGFGKTTLAMAVCANPRVQRHLDRRIYFFTIGQDVREPLDLARKITEITQFITGDTTPFSDPELAGAHLGRLLDQAPRALIVLDDVWEENHLRPFLHGGERCVRLITTRVPSILPTHAVRIRVAQMPPEQAQQVLQWQLPPLPQRAARDLLEATGRWPLLLRLTNRLIAAQLAAGADPTEAADAALHGLLELGPTAADDPLVRLDLDDPWQRTRAVRASMRAVTHFLPDGAAQRFAELGVFAEDEAVPVAVVAQLWRATGGLSQTHSRELCHRLHNLSLITVSAIGGGQLTLHDVYRDYLRSELGSERLVTVNAALVDAVQLDLPAATPLAPSLVGASRAWWELTNDYMLEHGIDHLLAAGQEATAEAVARDIRWVERRLYHRGPTAPWRDLTRIPTTEARDRALDLARIAHLLQPTQPPEALTTILHNRLGLVAEWQEQVRARHLPPGQAALLASGPTRPSQSRSAPRPVQPRPSPNSRHCARRRMDRHWRY